MAPRFGDSALPSRRSREAARRLRKSDRERALKLESLEPRLALASVAGLPDTVAPVVRSVTLPAAGTYGTDRALSFKVNFSESVKVVGNQADLFLPVEVGYAMHEARYVSGSGTKSLIFRMTVAANDVDTDGISLGRVNADAVRDFDFTADCIQDRAGNPASNVIPAVNTSRIRVDATGPVVASYGAFVTRGQQVSLKVIFDGPVTVTGKPTVPVTIEGKETWLTYASGTGTSTLTFAVTIPKGQSVANPAFRGENGLPGEVILLPKNANLKDRFGNAVTPIGGNFGVAYTDNGEPDGNRVVVIGTHFEKLKVGTSESVSKEELNTILTQEQSDFRSEEVKQIGEQKADYWAGYVPPVFEPVKNEVDLYRVAYRSTIPEQGNRPTVAYGLVAIPKGATGSLPLVSYQHGTLVLKESAPSQAFSWDKNSTAPAAFGLPEWAVYASAYETRLNVARFAGNGYAVIAADYFGIGNSVENDSFFVKGSAQQATLDMHAAAQKLFAGLSLSTDKLFLNGWSQGGVVTVALQEALEARGTKIDGVSTAAAPANTEMLVSRMLFNPRPYSTTTTPDAPWVVMIPQLGAFSLGGYGGKPGAALELFGGNYDFARKFYMREFKSIPGFEFKKDVRENMVPVMTMDGDTRPAKPSEFIVQRFGQDPRAYEKTIFAGLMRDAGAGKTRLESPMKMYYGTADDGSPESVATIVPTWQQGTFGKTNTETEPVPFASHRGAVLSATYGQLQWFDEIRLGKPAPVSAPPATPILARSLPPQSSPPQSPPIVAGSPPFVLPPAVNGIVEVSKWITADTTFRAGTVYVITGEVHVPLGVTLSIEDGVEVRIRNGRGHFGYLTSPALIFDSGSRLVAKNVTFQAANDANEPVAVAENGGVFFCGGTRVASRDNISSIVARNASSFIADSIVANYLGRKDPKGGDGNGNRRDDIDAISVIGAVRGEWSIKAVESNHAGNNGFSLTDSTIGMSSVRVHDPVEDGINLTSSILNIDTLLQVLMTEAEAVDREIFDFEIDNGIRSQIILPRNTATRETRVDLQGIWDNRRLDDWIDVDSADMKRPEDGIRQKYEWSGTLMNSSARIYSRKRSFVPPST
jgi:pimeloyl-ACP methyl ester carboxylesterase